MQGNKISLCDELTWGLVFKRLCHSYSGPCLPCGSCSRISRFPESPESWTRGSWYSTALSPPWRKTKASVPGTPWQPEEALLCLSHSVLDPGACFDSFQMTLDELGNEGKTSNQTALWASSLPIVWDDLLQENSTVVCFVPPPLIEWVYVFWCSLLLLFQSVQGRHYVGIRVLCMIF